MSYTPADRSQLIHKALIHTILFAGKGEGIERNHSDTILQLLLSFFVSLDLEEISEYAARILAYSYFRNIELDRETLLKLLENPQEHHQDGYFSSISKLWTDNRILVHQKILEKKIPGITEALQKDSKKEENWIEWYSRSFINSGLPPFVQLNDLLEKMYNPSISRLVLLKACVTFLCQIRLKMEKMESEIPNELQIYRLLNSIGVRNVESLSIEERDDVILKKGPLMYDRSLLRFHVQEQNLSRIRSYLSEQKVLIVTGSTKVGKTSVCHILGNEKEGSIERSVDDILVHSLSKNVHIIDTPDNVPLSVFSIATSIFGVVIMENANCLSAFPLYKLFTELSQNTKVTTIVLFNQADHLYNRMILRECDLERDQMEFKTMEEAFAYRDVITPEIREKSRVSLLKRFDVLRKEVSTCLPSNCKIYMTASHALNEVSKELLYIDNTREMPSDKIYGSRGIAALAFQEFRRQNVPEESLRVLLPLDLRRFKDE